MTGGADGKVEADRSSDGEAGVEGNTKQCFCFKCPTNVQTFSGEGNKTLFEGTNPRKANRTLTC